MLKVERTCYRYSTIFHKEDNFRKDDFLFPFLHIKSLLKRELL